MTIATLTGIEPVVTTAATPPRRYGLVVAGLALCALATLLPLLWTPYSGDDLVNESSPESLRDTNTTRWHAITTITSHWMRTEGRFFPGAVTFGVWVFTTFTSLIAYKIFLLALWLAVLVALAWWVARAFKDRWLGLLVATAMVPGLPFRYPVFHDAVASFGGLLPWTLLLMILPLGFSTRRPKRWGPAALVVTGTLWSLALLTYEVVVVLTPVALASVWVATLDRRWRMAVWTTIVVPTVISVVIVAFLRVSMSAQPTVGYTVRLDPGEVVVTTLKQMVAALPLAQWWVPGSPAPPVTLNAVGWTVAAVIGLLAALVFAESLRRLADVPHRHRVMLAAIGAWLWLGPALLTGVTARWQQQLQWGQGYLSVVFGAVGVSLLATAALVELKLRAGNHVTRPSVAVIGNGILIPLLAAGVGLTAAVNLAIVV